MNHIPRSFSYFAVFLMLLFSGSCKKDMLHWQRVQQLNSHTAAQLNHMSFIGNNTCIISGGIPYTQATTVRSTDGGYTWTANAYTQLSEMYGFDIMPRGDIYLCGISGQVLHSRDTGITWQQGFIPDGLAYIAGAFLTPNTGIFISVIQQQQCTITKVDSNFNILNKITYKFGVNDIRTVSASTGYILGYGALMKTTDTGTTWDFLDVKGDNFTAMDIHGDEIWMCGYIGCVYHSIDGGNNWERLRNGNDITIPHYNLMSIVFKDELNGWASCDDGRVIHTDDGGHHWEEYDRFTTNSLRSIVLCPNGDLLTSGDNGALYRITP